MVFRIRLLRVIQVEHFCVHECWYLSDFFSCHIPSYHVIGRGSIGFESWPTWRLVNQNRNPDFSCAGCISLRHQPTQGGFGFWLRGGPGGVAKATGWGLLGLISLFDCTTELVRTSDLQFAVHQFHAAIAITCSAYRDAAPVSGAALVRALYPDEVVEIQLADVFCRHGAPRF